MLAIFLIVLFIGVLSGTGTFLYQHKDVVLPRLGIKLSETPVATIVIPAVAPTADPAFLSVADQAVELLAKEDTEGFKQLLSIHALDQTAAADLPAYFNQLKGFFVGNKGPAGISQVVEGHDKAGNRGQEIYRFIIDHTGADRPYAVLVVDENGKPKIGNIVIDTTYQKVHGSN